MSDMNVCTFTGRLGQDPSTRAANDGAAHVTASMAVDTGFGERKGTMWLRLSLWGKRGEVFAAHHAKGDRVCVTGSLECRKYTAKDGGDRESWELKVNDWTFIRQRDDGVNTRASSSSGSSGDAPAPAFQDDDVPF